MNRLDLEYKIIGKGKTVIVIETGRVGYRFFKKIKG